MPTEMITVFGCATDREEINELSGSVGRGWMGKGPKVDAFETAFGAHIGADLVMVDSGSNALLLAVMLLDLPPGSEVIVPSFTWVACAHAVVLAGHRPVFADVDLETQNLDASSVERAITRRTGALMPVHYAGKPVRLEQLSEFGLPIIEDAAHAVDSKLGGKACGTIGRVGIFSFDSVKNLATPDGGGITSRDPDLLERARALRYCGLDGSGFSRSSEGGRWWEPTVIGACPRMLPNDVSASIGLVQLRKLAGHQARRMELWAAYQEQLADIDWLARPQGPATDERHSHFTYLIRVLDGRRDALAHALLQQGIYTTLRYAPLHASPFFDSSAELPNTDRLSEEGLNLPLHPALSDSDFERIIQAIRAW